MRRSDLYGILIVFLIFLLFGLMGRQDRLDNLRIECHFKPYLEDCKELQAFK